MLCIFLFLIKTGGGYSKNSGHFLVSTPGIYQFTWNTLSDMNYNAVTILKKNGQVVAYAHSGENRETMAGNSVVLQLTQGDEIWIDLRAGSTFYKVYGPYNTFSGVLVNVL